jgi:hypothetical protein
MARLTKIITVCDGCQGEVETAAFRVGVATGNTKALDLCDACQGRPFGEVVGAVRGVRSRGRRPGTTTLEQLEKLKSDRKVAAAAAPRKRAARKVAATKAE